MSNDSPESFRKRILIVDDSDALREVLTMIMEEAGYEVKSVEDGDHALEHIQEWSPDLVTHRYFASRS